MIVCIPVLPSEMGHCLCILKGLLICDVYIEKVSLSKGKGIPEQCNDFLKLEMEYYGICIPSISMTHRINKINVTLQLPKVCVNFMIAINAS